MCVFAAYICASICIVVHAARSGNGMTMVARGWWACVYLRQGETDGPQAKRELFGYNVTGNALGQACGGALRRHRTKARTSGTDHIQWRHTPSQATKSR